MLCTTLQMPQRSDHTHTVETEASERCARAIDATRDALPVRGACAMDRPELQDLAMWRAAIEDAMTGAIFRILNSQSVCTEKAR